MHGVVLGLQPLALDGHIHRLAKELAHIGAGDDPGVLRILTHSCITSAGLDGPLARICAAPTADAGDDPRLFVNALQGSESRY